ncbi:MAG: hypothetical protein R2810_04195 [Flavobacteriales bacterium]
MTSHDGAGTALDEFIAADQRHPEGPSPFVAVSELADSLRELRVVRLWVNADYWGVHFDTIETVKKRFDAGGISIPSRTDVHTHAS